MYTQVWVQISTWMRTCGFRWTYMWTCAPHPLPLPLFSTSPTRRLAHTSNATIKTAMCTVNFKELKGRFRKRVTHTCLLGNVHALHSDSSATFSYVIRNSNQLSVCHSLKRQHIPFHAAVLLLAACHQFLSTKGNCATLCQNCTGFGGKALWARHGWCDSDIWYYFRELESPDTRRGGNMSEYGIVKGDYSCRLWNVSSANQIKSRINPDEKRTKYESTMSSTNITGVKMFFLIVKRLELENIQCRALKENSSFFSLTLEVTICRIFKWFKSLNAVARWPTTKMNVAFVLFFLFYKWLI